MGERVISTSQYPSGSSEVPSDRERRFSGPERSVVLGLRKPLYDAVNTPCSNSAHIKALHWCFDAGICQSGGSKRLVCRQTSGKNSGHRSYFCPSRSYPVNTVRTVARRAPSGNRSHERVIAYLDASCTDKHVADNPSAVHILYHIAAQHALCTRVWCGADSPSKLCWCYRRRVLVMLPAPAAGCATVTGGGNLNSAIERQFELIATGEI